MAEELDLFESQLKSMKQEKAEEEEARRRKDESALLEMKLRVADERLAAISAALGTTLTNVVERAKKVAEEHAALEQEVASLRELKRTREEARTRWERIADLATASISLDAGNAAERARSVAEYADQLSAETEKRF